MEEEHALHDEPQSAVRRYRRRGVEVEIREPGRQFEAADETTGAKPVELRLDGMPIQVSIIDGKYHSQLANQFTDFETIDDVVETLLANEGRTWTLHGGLNVPGGHHPGRQGGQNPPATGGHGNHDHDAHDHGDHDHGGGQ